MYKWVKQLFKASEISDRVIDVDAVPYHVAIICDGNGRWAKRRGLPRVAGHRAGMKMVKEITMAADEIGVKVLTLYTFSTENWTRPAQEVEYIMKLPEEFFRLWIDELVERRVKVCFIGDVSGTPDYTQRVVEKVVERTAHCDGMLLNIALNYGSRFEMVEAVRAIAKSVRDGSLDIDDVCERTMSDALWTAGLPDPDLLIRTSGEVRLSNFLLWQLAYTELWFTNVYWPAFTREHFFSAVQAYQSRGRRFGGLS